MIGKISDGPSSSILYAPVTKTSQSGFFSNQRLAILSTKDGTLGYLSKVPETLDSFQDHQCLQKCKEVISLTTISTFNYVIGQEDPSKLSIFWENEGTKSWQFKFQTAEAAQEWASCMDAVIAADKQKKLSANNGSSSPGKLPVKDFQPRFSPQKELGSREGGKVEPTTPISRLKSFDEKHKPRKDCFRRFQEKDSPRRHKADDALSVISTYVDKKKNGSGRAERERKMSYVDSRTDWNLRWWRAHESGMLLIYNQFLKHCKQLCTDIHEELLENKSTRKFIPTKLTNREEVYLIEGVEFKMVNPHLPSAERSQELNEHLLRDLQQEVQAHRFVLAATRNQLIIKVPLCCIVKHMGHIFTCHAQPPSEYRQIDKSSIYLYKPHILSLQDRLKVRLNRQEVLFYAKSQDNNAGKISQGNSLLLLNIGRLLPTLKIHDSTITFHLRPQHFISSSGESELPQVAADRLRTDHQAQAKLLLSEQGHRCCVISVDDLEDVLRRNRISTELVAWLAARVDSNTYMKSILLSQAVAQQFEVLLWEQASQHIRRKPYSYSSTLEYLLSEVLSAKGEAWTKISRYLYSQYELVAKQEELILGYLFSSISAKTGAQFEYQLLIDNQDLFFLSGSSIPPYSLKQINTVAISLASEDISQKESSVIRKVEMKSPTSQVLQEVVAHYGLLQTSLPPSHLSLYSWRKICRLLCQFIPFGKEQQFKHLHIFQQTQPEHLDYQVFVSTRSAIKWLLVDHHQARATAIADLFRSDSSFWLKEFNPFAAQLSQLIGNYLEQQGRPEEAVQHIQATVDELGNLLGKEAAQECLERNLRLAQLLKVSGKLKQSLQKLKLARQELYRGRDHKKMLLGVLVDMGQLYLHLGSTQKSIQCCRQAIEHSTVQPFQNYQQQMLVYECLLRALEIEEDWPKFKFYLDILEERVREKSEEGAIKQVLKYTAKQVISDMSRYALKKLLHLMYNSEVFELKTQKSEGQIALKQVRRGGESVFGTLRNVMPRVVQISLGIADGHLQAKEEGELLWKLVRTVGVDYVLGCASSLLK